MDAIDVKELKDTIRRVFNDTVAGYKKLRGLNSREKKFWRKYKKDGTDVSLCAYRDACRETSEYERSLRENGIMLYTDDMRSWEKDIAIIELKGFSGKRKFAARIELYGDID